MRFVPVPYAALDVVPEHAAVVDLYQRAHRLRWAPYKVTARSLATSWGMSTRRVWDVLSELESAGLLAIERGGKRSASTITVYDPSAPIDEKAPSARAGHRVSHKVSHKVSQNYSEPTGDIADPESQGEPQGDPQGVPTLNDHELEHEPELESKTPIGVVWSSYVEHHPRLARRQPTEGERKLIRSALKSASVDGMTQAQVLAMVIEWAHRAPDAAFYRGENEQRKAYLGLSVLLRLTKLADKIDAAIAWRDGQAPQASRRYLN